MRTPTTARHNAYRNQLLATVSVLVLLGSTYGTSQAENSDADRPPLWIELGWQFENVGGGQELFAPPFASMFPSAGFPSPQKFEKMLPWSYGANGKISFQPEGSDWVFSAAMRFGRAHGHKFDHEQHPSAPIDFGTEVITPPNIRFAQTDANNSESHSITDFQVGKDVGLGLLGRATTSVLSAGVRFANFNSRSHSVINAVPTKYVPVPPKNIFKYAHAHIYSAANIEAISFHGIGPSISWTASTPLMGDQQESEVSLDWGINAAALFGKQKISGHHNTHGAYYKGVYHPHPLTSYDNSGTSNRERTVTVPNVGGFASLSLNWTNAKISLGYRADVFFNAIDGGIDSRKSYNRGFYGPFASISFGLGD